MRINIPESKNSALFIFILFIALFVRVLSFGGYEGSDDAAYTDFAYKISQGNYRIMENYSGPPVFPLRIGLSLPVALGFKLFGPSESAVVSYPLVISILSIVLAFLTAKAFFNIRAALIAAFIYAILPIDMRCASTLMPDLIGAFWVNVGILLIVYASKNDSLALKAAYGLLAGISVGIAWFCKETIAYAIPFIILYLFWLTCRRKHNAIILASVLFMCAAVLAAESAMYYIHTHDFFYRYHLIERNYQFDQAWYGATWGKETGITLARRMLIDNPKAIFMNADFSFVTLSALLGIGYAIFRKSRNFLAPGFWFIFLALFFNFGSASLKSYRLLALYQYRYMYPLLLPAVLITAGVIDLLIPASKKILKEQLWRERLFLGGILAAGIFFTSLFGIVKHVWQGKYSKAERLVSRMVTPDALVYTDVRSAAVLKLFWKYSSQLRMHEFSGMGADDIPAGAYVLINRGRVDWINSKYGYSLPQFYKNIPDHWMLKLDKARAQLYWVPIGK